MQNFDQWVEQPTYGFPDTQEVLQLSSDIFIVLALTIFSGSSAIMGQVLIPPSYSIIDTYGPLQLLHALCYPLCFVLNTEFV